MCCASTCACPIDTIALVVVQTDACSAGTEPKSGDDGGSVCATCVGYGLRGGKCAYIYAYEPMYMHVHTCACMCMHIHVPVGESVYKVKSVLREQFCAQNTCVCMP